MYGLDISLKLAAVVVALLAHPAHAKIDYERLRGLAEDPKFGITFFDDLDCFVGATKDNSPPRLVGMDGSFKDKRLFNAAEEWKVPDSFTPQTSGEAPVYESLNDKSRITISDDMFPFRVKSIFAPHDITTMWIDSPRLGGNGSVQCPFPYVQLGLENGTKPRRYGAPGLLRSSSKFPEGTCWNDIDGWLQRPQDSSDYDINPSKDNPVKITFFKPIKEQAKDILTSGGCDRVGKDTWDDKLHDWYGKVDGYPQASVNCEANLNDTQENWCRDIVGCERGRSMCRSLYG